MQQEIPTDFAMHEILAGLIAYDEPVASPGAAGVPIVKVFSSNFP